MKLRFWGVRGSIPAPLSSEQVQAKISAAVQRLTAKDIQSVEAKSNFIASLPGWLFGTVGGNTSCVEILSEAGDRFILDCGSGLRALGAKLSEKEIYIFHIFLSHFHWDHLQGLPFFTPAFSQKNQLHFYSLFPAAKKLLEKQMSQPFFPIAMDHLTKDMHFHLIRAETPFSIGNTVISCKKMKHPGNSYSYSFCEQGKKIVYSTDVELTAENLDKKSENSFFSQAEALIIDSQYTMEEAVLKVNWGHSPFSRAVDFAANCNVKRLFLFHHEPSYDDKRLYTILENAREYAAIKRKTGFTIELAAEGKELNL